MLGSRDLPFNEIFRIGGCNGGFIKGIRRFSGEVF